MAAMEETSNPREEKLQHEYFTEPLSKRHEQHQQYTMEEGYDTYAAANAVHRSPVKRNKQKEKTLMQVLCAWVVQHQIGKALSECHLATHRN